jgi:hypothetical protein
VTDQTPDLTEPDNPAAYALARHIADHPVSTIQAAFRYLNAPLTVELHDSVSSAVAQSAPAETALRDRIAALTEDLRYVLDYRGPRHAHERPGVWDTSGKPCEHCARLAAVRKNLDACDADPDAVLAVLPAAVDRGVGVTDAIRTFPFDNFGMDDVSFALEDDPEAQEWVPALADAVLATLPATAAQAVELRDYWHAEAMSATTRIIELEGQLEESRRAAAAPAVDRPAEEAYRLAVSTALRLGTGATWEAIRDRAEDLVAEVAELAETSRRLLEQRQEMAAERFAWQERGDRAEARVRQMEAAASDDRATVLNGVQPQTLNAIASHVDARSVAILRPDSEAFAGWQAVAALLRRMAVEAQQPRQSGLKVDDFARMSAGADVIAGRAQLPFDQLSAEEQERHRQAARTLLERAAEADAETPVCPDPIECGHEAALGQAQQEIRSLREKHKASLRRADKVNNELMEEVQRYAIGAERPVLWSVYNRMHGRAAHAEAALNRVGRIARRLAAHAVGFKDVLDASDHGPWGRTVGADIAELIEALSDLPAVVPGGAGEEPADETSCCVVCGAPVEWMDVDVAYGSGWIHSPDSDTPCLNARPRCPDCQMPHVITPGMQLACASILASIRDRDAAIDPQPVRHAPGVATLCADCRAKGHTVCMDDAVSQPKEAEGDRIVAYRSTGARVLRCPSCYPDETTFREGDLHPVTSEDLPDGGLCTRCGVDVLIPQEPRP